MDIDYKTNLINRKQVDKLWDESEDRVTDQIKNLKKSIKKRRLGDWGEEMKNLEREMSRLLLISKMALPIIILLSVAIGLLMARFKGLI